MLSQGQFSTKIVSTWPYQFLPDILVTFYTAFQNCALPAFLLDMSIFIFSVVDDSLVLSDSVQFVRAFVSDFNMLKIFCLCILCGFFSLSETNSSGSTYLKQLKIVSVVIHVFCTPLSFGGELMSCPQITVFFLTPTQMFFDIYTLYHWVLAIYFVPHKKLKRVNLSGNHHLGVF